MDKSGLYQHPVPNDVGSTTAAKPPFYKIAESPSDEFFEEVIIDLGHSIREQKTCGTRVVGGGAILDCWSLKF